jgi:hypothetical protein
MGTNQTESKNTLRIPEQYDTEADVRKGSPSRAAARYAKATRIVPGQSLSSRLKSLTDLAGIDLI